MKIFSSILVSMLTLPVLAADVITFTDSQLLAMDIATAPLAAADTQTSTYLPGKVTVPNAQLHIVTVPQRGLVENLLAAEGDVVTQGQVLARIQSPSLLEVQSEYLEINTRFRLAKSNYDRDRQLHEEGIIAERRLLESKAKYSELLTSLTRVRRILELSGMDTAALAQLRKTRQPDSALVVSAPVGGVVLEQMATTGTRVEAADPLYRVASLMPLWLEVHVPLDKLAEIQPGQTVFVPSVDVSGTVITIGKMVHGADQGVLVRAEIREGADKLYPGQFLKVQLVTASGNGGYRVPRSAVTRFEGSSYVFAADPAGFLPVPVSVVGEETNTLVIEAELPDGASIAVSGTVAIKAAWLGGE